MIDNDFIYELTIDLDLEKITELVKKIQFNKMPDMAGHHRLVKNDPYMSSLKDRFPFLSPIFNIYTTRPFGQIPLHIDAKRSCAFNIPIEYTEESETIFYGLVGDPVLQYNPQNVFYFVNSSVKELFRFSLVRPVLINNSGPHKVLNHSKNHRVILSWSVHEDYTFEQAKELFKKAGV
jgi:hypothetical protein